MINRKKIEFRNRTEHNWPNNFQNMYKGLLMRERNVFFQNYVTSGYLYGGKKVNIDSYLILYKTLNKRRID